MSEEFIMEFINTKIFLLQLSASILAGAGIACLIVLFKEIYSMVKERV